MGRCADDRARFITEIKRHCRRRLRADQVPVKIVIVAAMAHGDRVKRIRANPNR